MQVNIIEPVGGHGGMNYYDMGLAKGLVAHGVRVNWYTCDKTHETDQPGIRVVKCFKGVYGKQHKVFRLVRFIFALLNSLLDIKRQRGRLVHFHFFHLTMLEWLCLWASKLAGLATIATVHDVDSFAGESHPAMANRILKLTDRFIVHNQVSAVRLSEVLTAFGLNKPIRIIPHGHYLDNVTTIDQSAARSALGLPVEKKIFLFFGQIKAVKGLNVLLNAMKTVVANHPDVLLLIAGKVWKDDFSQYMQLINKLGLHENVRLDIRYIPDEQVSNYYCAADFVVLPYKKIFQSGVLLMAMSYGTPVITSNIPGMTEIVTDGINGLTFQSEDVASLAASLLGALSMDNNERQQLSSRALELMHTKHSWERIGQLTLSEYQHLEQ